MNTPNKGFTETVEKILNELNSVERLIKAQPWDIGTQNMLKDRISELETLYRELLKQVK